jgi:hypothetical protein
MSQNALILTMLENLYATFIFMKGQSGFQAGVGRTANFVLIF